MEYQGLPVKVRRQKRRSLMMRRTYHAIEVFIPHWLHKDHNDVRAFIEEGLAKLDDLPPLPQREEITTPDELRAMVREWAVRMGVQPKRITLRAMTRKWGSCSSRDNVTLNTALCYVPRRLAEYVIVHELAHLIELNHGPKFKALMDAYLPDWREREKEINTYPV